MKIVTKAFKAKEEVKRLKQLHFYNILKTSKEDQFDNITQLISYQINIPVVLITLIDQDRIWYKSKTGIDIKSIHRKFSPNNYVINNKSPLIIEDLKLDEQFTNNPLIKKHDFRFYAGVPIVTPKGQIIGTLCVYDILPKKTDKCLIDVLTMYARTIMDLIILKRENHKIQNLSKIKDDFLSNMNHEIRTPLNAIIGFNDLLSKHLKTKEAQTYSGIINEAGTQLKVLLNDILDIKNLKKGKLHLKNSPNSIRELCEYIIKITEQPANEKGLTLNYNIDANIPDILEFDKPKLSQLFLHVLNNAIKFTHKGFISMQVKLLCINTNKAYIRFKIKDTGIGIPQNKLKLIFKNFFQIENFSTKRYEGVGIGLTLVKKLVALFNGKIKVDSIVNSGTTILIDIPFNIPNPLPKLRTNKQGSTKLSDLNILIVEDNKFNQQLAKTILTKHHARVDLASNGKIALKQIQKNNYSLILMDLQMPIMDGYTCSKHIRNKLKLTTPIIACTANTMNNERKKCLNIGINEFLSKPYLSHELINIVSKYKA
ncbi:GAF domain-containing hybrid sensor histidine kinase/response regulator [Aestuariibaculum sediminum]|uniref:histidine kinase n=1 Tax=Aestuariibaculum sediminum TaxID=2770637 RepID=A0A8J6Q1W4_9FLAO|nr:GAF domain-containing hybrid sensor histidine kinase/response regulator [Aestuariibaculum sediminum]MBD0831415.1 response regulator [Aestuariibaculum sediminum]